jgi:uncharacterized membrane protein YgdD (TMEM256/DUF423 family)
MVWFAWAAVFAAIAVVLGAFGAHALRDRLGPTRLTTFHTGVQYHFYHALGLAAVGAASSIHESALWQVAGWLFVIGIILFSGSLYGLATTERRAFGPITPLGGVCFIAGWVVFAIAAFTS